MHDLRGNYILFLNKPGTTSYGLSSLFSYVSAKLRNALPDFIRTYEFTGFKRESRLVLECFAGEFRRFAARAPGSTKTRHATQAMTRTQ